MGDTALGAALALLERSAGSPSTFHEPFLELFPASGAAVSTVGEVLGSETVAASDAVALRVDELQFDLGEGPCWDALALGRPVLEPDIREHPRIVWPLFSAALAEHPVRSLFAFPLIVGTLRFGAVDLYSEAQIELSSAQTKQAIVLAGAVGEHVLRRALQVAGDYEDPGNANTTDTRPKYGPPNARRLSDRSGPRASGARRTGVVFCQDDQAGGPAALQPLLMRNA